MLTNALPSLSLNPHVAATPLAAAPDKSPDGFARMLGQAKANSPEPSPESPTPTRMANSPAPAHTPAPMSAPAPTPSAAAPAAPSTQAAAPAPAPNAPPGNSGSNSPNSASSSTEASNGETTSAAPPANPGSAAASDPDGNPVNTRAPGKGSNRGGVLTRARRPDDTSALPDTGLPIDPLNPGDSRKTVQSAAPEATPLGLEPGSALPTHLGPQHTPITDPAWDPSALLAAWAAGTPAAGTPAAGSAEESSASTTLAAADTRSARTPGVLAATATPGTTAGAPMADADANRQAVGSAVMASLAALAARGSTAPTASTGTAPAANSSTGPLNATAAAAAAASALADPAGVPAEPRAALNPLASTAAAGEAALRTAAPLSAADSATSNTSSTSSASSTTGRETAVLGLNTGSALGATAAPTSRLSVDTGPAAATGPSDGTRADRLGVATAATTATTAASTVTTAATTSIPSTTENPAAGALADAPLGVDTSVRGAAEGQVTTNTTHATHATNTTNASLAVKAAASAPAKEAAPATAANAPATTPLAPATQAAQAVQAIQTAPAGLQSQPAVEGNRRDTRRLPPLGEKETPAAGASDAASNTNKLPAANLPPQPLPALLPTNTAAMLAAASLGSRENLPVNTERSATAEAAGPGSPGSTPGAATLGWLAPATPSITATPAAQGRLEASPGTPAFATQLAAQVTTFVRDGVQTARLELNPAEMGPLTVQIQLDGNAARVHLAAENAQTRQALEQAMPQLAGNLRESGLTLSGGGVFEQPRQPQQQAQAQAGGNPDGNGQRGSPERGGRDGSSGGRDTTPGVAATSPGRRQTGVVDLIA